MKALFAKSHRVWFESLINMRVYSPTSLPPEKTAAAIQWLCAAGEPHHGHVDRRAAIALKVLNGMKGRFSSGARLLREHYVVGKDTEKLFGDDFNSHARGCANLTCALREFIKRFNKAGGFKVPTNAPSESAKSAPVPAPQMWGFDTIIETPETLGECYALLEVPEGAPLAEVRKAYLNKQKLFHPDKWQQSGPDERAGANELVKAYNAAWQWIKSGEPVGRS